MSDIPRDFCGPDQEYAGEIHVSVTVLKSGLSPRLAGENSAHVRMLSELDVKLPPILVHRASMRVIDGMHRLQAAILRGDETIAVQFLDCDESEVFAAAVEMNVKHGLPLSLTDRKAAARRILATNSQWSDRKIGSITGLSHKTVGVMRANETDGDSQSHVRIGRDGRVRQLSTRSGLRKSADTLHEESGNSLRETARSADLSRADQARGVLDHRTTVDDRTTELETDVEAILQSLSRDPSLRFSETGRLLVRLLRTCSACTAKLEEVAAKAPSHQATVIARLVGAYADSLSSVRRQLEQEAPGL